MRKSIMTVLVVLTALGALAGPSQRAAAQEIPASVVGELRDCQARGGWMDKATDLCLICPKDLPERTDQPATGDSACRRPKGYVEVQPKSRQLPLGSNTWNNPRRCYFDETRKGNTCYSCPQGALGSGLTCRRFQREKLGAAERLDHTQCENRAWTGDDGLCYRCPTGTYRMLKRGPRHPRACHLDPKAEMPGVAAERAQRDLSTRASLDAVLSEILAGGMASARTDTARVEAMRALLQADQDEKVPVDFVLWLRPDPAQPGRAMGGAMGMLGRKRDPKLHCYQYEAVTLRPGAPEGAKPTDTLIAGWGHSRDIDGDQMVGYVAPDPGLTGVWTGYDWLRYPNARRLVWDIGVGPGAQAYYRHIQIQAVGDGPVDCSALSWP